VTFDLESYFRSYKETAYNFKTTGQILVQFYMALYLAWFCKSNRSQ